MERQSDIKENSAWANSGLVREAQWKRERDRLKEKERHPTVEKKLESQLRLLNQFIKLRCHLTKPSQAGKWLKIGHRHGRSDIHTHSVCHHLRSQLKKPWINKSSLSISKTHAHTDRLPLKSIRRWIAQTRQMLEVEVLKAGCAVSNSQQRESHMHLIAFPVF